MFFSLASLPAIATAQPASPAAAPFSCDATRLADLPPDLAITVARDACETLRRVSGGRGRFSVVGQREGDRYALLLRDEATGRSELGTVETVADVSARVSVLGRRWSAPEKLPMVPEKERQLTFSLVTMVPLGPLANGSGTTAGASVAYRYAAPRWSLGGVAELTGSPFPDDALGGALLHGSLAFSARHFLSVDDNAWFIGGGAGLLGITQHWTTYGSTGDCGMCVGPFSGKEVRSLGTFAPFAEAGYVALRTGWAQLAVSLRIDVPLERMDRWEGPRGQPTSPGDAREYRPPPTFFPSPFASGCNSELPRAPNG